MQKWDWLLKSRKNKKTLKSSSVLSVTIVFTAHQGRMKSIKNQVPNKMIPTLNISFLIERIRITNK